ncbi:follicle-stimulating hormone receptor-like [Actinia tenebrosa]|uniref:Follicle-stimulating hormone receptor-like n=1 Tax=Actinia tenebrosa TaxID=6105 RepID=A0A6P8IIV7_ACTTE|nr:follicle-stimulating hormone receptor-like [Actinia tenebrosa]
MVILSIQVRSETCSAPDHHVNNSYYGNSSCIRMPTLDTGLLFVKCRLRQMRDLGELLPHKNSVHTLDLFNNSIDGIEDDVFLSFDRLVTLNLSHNRIRHIGKDAFRGLESLQILDLSFNLMQTWDTIDVTKHLSFLIQLDVTSNPLSSPITQIASLSNLTTFKGLVSYSDPIRRNCIWCSLIRNPYSSLDVNKSIFRFQINCSRYTILPRINLSAFWKLNFSVICQEVPLHAKLCSAFCSRPYPSSYYSVHISHLCLQEIIKWTLPNIPIGVIAIVTNSIVMLTVASSRALRKNVAMLLVCNMALGDFLLGLFLVILTVLRRTISNSEYIEMSLSAGFFCGSLLTLVITAQCLSVLVGFLVVIERYLCIVFSMNPGIRITKSIAKLLLTGIWFIIIIIVSLPFALHMYLVPDDYSCINYKSPESHSTYVHYLQMVSIAISSCSYILYGHMFYTVRQSGLNVGIKRDVRMAKMILLVVSTNIFFSVAPTAIVYWTVNLETVGSSVTRFAIWNTVGLLFYGVNSCLNPFLYAFRNDKVLFELKKLLRYKRNPVTDVPKRNPQSTRSKLENSVLGVPERKIS